MAAVWYTGTTRAESGAHGTVIIGATGLTVTATGTRPAVNIDSLNITTGGLAVGVTVARAMLQRNTEAATLAVGSVATSGAVSVSASSTNGTVVSTPGGAFGGVAIALMFPYAEISGHTRVQVDGSVTASASVSMEAQASNAATATALVASVSFAAGASGAYAQAVITSDADTTARVGSSASLASQGAITLRAHGTGQNNIATASAKGGAGGIFLAGTVMVSYAFVDAGVTADFGGSVPSAASLTVEAFQTNTATSETIAASLSGLASGAAAASLADIGQNADVTAAVSGGPISVTGAVTVTATGPNVAQAQSDAGAASFGLGIGVSLPTARVQGAVLASVSGTIVASGSVAITATGTNTATAKALALSAGLFSGSGASSDAQVTNAADVTAEITSTGSVTSAGAVSLSATGHNSAAAESNGGSGGAITISVMIPTATVGGGVLADANGKVQGGSLDVKAVGENAASATTKVVAIGIGAGAGAYATATITADAVTTARIGSSGSVAVTGAVTVDSNLAGQQNLATAKATGGAGGVISAGGFGAGASVAGGTTAEVNGAVTAASALTVTATGTNHAIADTDAVTIGAATYAGASSYAHITPEAKVAATAASTAAITISGTTAITATGTNLADATSDAGSGGFIAVGSSVPTARIEGSVIASFGGSATGGSGFSVTANGTNTATVGSNPLSIGFAFSNPGATIVADITALAQVTASVLAGATLDLANAAATVDAVLHNQATATSNGGGGGAISAASLEARAHDGGGSSAVFAGRLLSASSLKVGTDASHAANSKLEVINIGILGSSTQTGSFADVGASGQTGDALDSAVIGGSARISSPGTAITVSVIRGAISTAASSGGGGGFVGIAGLRSTSTTRGGVSARVENGAVVGTDTGRPGALTVRATDASVSASNSSVGSGGFVSSAESRAVALSAPSVSAYLDNGVAVVLQDGSGHDVVVQALSNRAEADALANNSGGGGVDVASTYAETSSLPVVRASVGTGSTVRIGGALLVDAESLAIPASNVPLTDLLTALVVHDAPPPASIATWDSVQFPQHGLNTGDQVLYESTGAPITGLRSGHLYSVIVLDANTLRFGVTFTGALVDATALGSVSGVDPLRSMVRFAGPHHFENGDAVVYRTSGATILPGVADGEVLYVRVIDPNTIELYRTAAEATAAALPLTGPGAAPIAGNQITDGTLADGARVTYQSAPPLPFTNVGVNVTVDATGKVTGRSPTAYNVFLGTVTVPGVNPTIVGHGLTEGQQVVYQTLNPTPIAGLVSGGTYFVHLDSDWTVQLAATYCDAVGSDEDPTCAGTDTNGDPVPHPRAVIHIVTPDNCAITPLPPSCSVASAIRPDEIGGLTSGYTYQVHRVDPTTITLRTVGGTSDLDLDPTHRAGDYFGQQQLFGAGLGLQVSSDQQQLYLRLTGALGVSKLLAPDGTSLRTSSPPPGDGLTSSSARGGGGGGISFREPTAHTTISPTVVASFAGVAVTGGDVTISSETSTNGSASTSNGSGGFISVADVDSQIFGTNTTSAYVGVDPIPLTGDSGSVQVDGSGASITSGGNVRLGATTVLATNATASSNSGGFVGTGSSSARAHLTDRTAVAVGANASVTGATVALLGQTSSNGSVNPHITTGGLFGSATANADYNLDSLVLALLDGVASSTGAITGVYGVDVRTISHDNRFSRNPDATCYCIGPSNNNRQGSVSLSDVVSAHQGMTVYAGPRLRGGPLVDVPSKSFLVLYVQAEEYSNDASGPRAIHWNSDVVANAGASPSLVIDADGKVASAVNIRVNGVTDPAPGDPLGLHPYLEVEDLRNAGSADIWMTSVGGTIDGGSCVGGANDNGCKLGTTAGTHYWGTFTFNMSWSSVTILNQSARRLVIDDIDPISRNATPTVTLNAPSGSSNPTFAIRFGVDATLITIRNSHPSGPDLLLNGTIENPVGETRVTNDAGPVTASSQRGGLSTFDGTHSSLLRSNIVRLVAGTGLGTADHYLVVDLVAYAAHPVVLTADAGASAYLDLLSHLRDSKVPDPANTPGAAYTFSVGPIVAGDSVFARLRTSVYETGSGTAGFVQVTSTGPSPTGPYSNFYYPDIPFTRGNTEGAFAANPHPINSTYDFSLLDAGATVGTGSITVDAANPADIVDTHRINIVALSDIRDTGNITMHTSGYIVDTEKTGGSPGQRHQVVRRRRDPDRPGQHRRRARRQRHPAVPGQRRSGRHRRQHQPRRGHRGAGQHRRSQQLPRGRRRLRPLRPAERQGSRQGLHPRDHRRHAVRPARRWWRCRSRGAGRGACGPGQQLLRGTRRHLLRQRLRRRHADHGERVDSRRAQRGPRGDDPQCPGQPDQPRRPRGRYRLPDHQQRRLRGGPQGQQRRRLELHRVELVRLVPRHPGPARGAGQLPDRRDRRHGHLRHRAVRCRGPAHRRGSGR